MHATDRILDLNEAAEILGVSRWTVRRMVDAGELPVIRLERRGRAVRRLLFDLADLRQLIQASKSTEA